MPLIIPDELLQHAQMTEQELKTEIALLLYARHNLSIGRAAELAGMPKF